MVLLEWVQGWGWRRGVICWIEVYIIDRGMEGAVLKDISGVYRAILLEICWRACERVCW